MASFTLIVIHALLLVVPQWTLGLEQHYKHDAHTIMKRMAEVNQGFEGHDVATVHLVEGQGRRKKRLAKRDLSALRDIHNLGSQSVLELELSSGSTVNLDLKPAGIVDPETIVSFHTERGRVEGKRGTVGCYFHGQIGDSSGKGWAAVSHCDGLFGFANSPGYEYYLHPVEVRRSKRDTQEEFDVHIMWRNAKLVNNSTLVSNDFIISRSNDGEPLPKGTDADRLNATGFVIELAMFTDAQYWAQLQEAYPGREDDFILTRLAATQALYSNPKLVGYDVQIKLRRLEYWPKNPVGYTFVNKLSVNLRNFCSHTRKKHVYDMHVLNTGVTKYDKGVVGLAYLGGACTKKRCVAAKGYDLKTFVLHAHEMGHNLGLSHHDVAKCPRALKSVGGGFMGGGDSYNFSPCMKYELAKFLGKRKSNCLFKERRNPLTPESFSSYKALPGQFHSPDKLCHILAGYEYKYVPLWKSLGFPVCKWFTCLNENTTSPAYGRAKWFTAPEGFPCDHESFCNRKGFCKLWEQVRMALEVQKLKNLTQSPEWSEWSTEMSNCSRKCGTGVRTRHRECKYPALNLATYCPGTSVQAELCNIAPCRGDKKKTSKLRKARGNELCARFRKNDVKLKLKKSTSYKALAKDVSNKDVGAGLSLAHSKSCLIKCQRNRPKMPADLDAFMPDGTPCIDFKRPKPDYDRLNIQLRCLRGLCQEFSDCPVQNQIKDKCGICGGTGDRCVHLTFDSSFNVRKGQRSFLTIIPAGASNIEVTMNWKDHNGVILELWSYDGDIIIGNQGQYPLSKYKGSNTVPFAGTRWTYNRKSAYLKAPGATDTPVIIRALRRKASIKSITIIYVKKAEDPPLVLDESLAVEKDNIVEGSLIGEENVTVVTTPATEEDTVIDDSLIIEKDTKVDDVVEGSVIIEQHSLEAATNVTKVDGVVEGSVIIEQHALEAATNVTKVDDVVEGSVVIEQHALEAATNVTSG